MTRYRDISVRGLEDTGGGGGGLSAWYEADRGIVIYVLNSYNFFNENCNYYLTSLNYRNILSHSLDCNVTSHIVAMIAIIATDLQDIIRNGRIGLILISTFRSIIR